MAVSAHEVIYSISDAAGLLGRKRLQLGGIKILYGCQQLVRRGTNLGGEWVDGMQGGHNSTHAQRDASMLSNG